MVDQLENYVLKDVDGLERLKERGRGCYGSVYELTVNGVPCIGKRLHNILLGRVREVQVSDQERTTIIGRFKLECDVLSRLRHPNVVQFMGVHLGATEMDVTLIMESLHMDLEKCIKTHNHTLTLPYKFNILRDIAYGLSYLHSCSVIHRDLNQGNVLLTEALTAKIADLGASKVIDYSNEVIGMSTFPGALGYMPPEAMQSPAVYDTKLDCFSFGQLSLYVLNGVFPSLVDSNITAKDVQEKSIQMAKRRSSLISLGSSHVMYNVIVQCLSDEPYKRPSSRELASIMTNVSSLYPIQYKNILDYIEIINGLQMTTTSNELLENSIPTTSIENNEHSDDFLPVRVTNSAHKSMSPDTASGPNSSLLPSPSIKPSNSLHPNSFGPVPLRRNSISPGPILPPRSTVSPSPGPILPPRSSVSPSPGPIPSPRGSVSPSPGPITLPRSTVSPSPGPIILPRSTVSPSPGPISLPRSTVSPSPSPIPSPRGSVSPSLVHITLPPRGPVSPTPGPISPTSGNHPPFSHCISSTQGPSSQIVPSITPTPDDLSTPTNSLHQSTGTFSYDYVDTTERTISEHVQERINNGPSVDESLGIRTLLSLDQPVNTKQSSLTELFDQYDSDDDSYECVSDYFPGKPCQPTTTSLRNTVQISDHDNGLTTSSLPPAIITQYASPSNLTSSGNYIYDKMSREIAEALCCNNGDYLVRASPTTGGLVLSVRLGESECGHLSIHKTVNKKFQSTKTAYYFNDGDLFDSLTDLITDLASSPFYAESKQIITLNTAVTVEERKILEPNEIIAGGLLDKKRQYTLSSSVIAANNEEITAKILTSNQYQVIWEGYILNQLDHFNVVKMMGLCIEKPVCLLLEKCARNCLSDYLISHGKTLDASFFFKVLVDITSGISYLHSKSYIHRSLAARNCILSNDFTTAKVANLQKCSKVSSDTATVSDYTNFAIGWASPEILNTGEYSKSSDVWSFGVFMWEIFNNGKEPYGGLSKAQLLDKIHTRSTIQLPTNAPPSCVNAFNKCFMNRPQDRPTMIKLNHLLQEAQDVESESIYY